MESDLWGLRKLKVSPMNGHPMLPLGNPATSSSLSLYFIFGETTKTITLNNNGNDNIKTPNNIISMLSLPSFNTIMLMTECLLNLYLEPQCNLYFSKNINSLFRLHICIFLIPNIPVII